jgi:cytochrome c-type biogenesis protein CcmH
MLQNTALEARARALSQELRCVVCQNQSIDDSNAPLAHDLRVLLRERLQSGDSDRQAIDFIVARYGNFVLLKPPMQWNTLLLWGGPLLLLLIAGFGFGRYVRNSAAKFASAEASPRLGDNELKRVDVILNNGRSP